MKPGTEIIKKAVTRMTKLRKLRTMFDTDTFPLVAINLKLYATPLPVRSRWGQILDRHSIYLRLVDEIAGKIDGFRVELSSQAE
jgi:hypothetical protein